MLNAFICVMFCIYKYYYNAININYSIYIPFDKLLSAQRVNRDKKYNIMSKLTSRLPTISRNATIIGSRLVQQKIIS